MEIRTVVSVQNARRCQQRLSQGCGRVDTGSQQIEAIRLKQGLGRRDRSVRRGVVFCTCREI